MGVHGFGEVDNKDATKSESTGHCIKKQAPTTAYAEKKATILKTTLGHYSLSKKKKTKPKPEVPRYLKVLVYFFKKKGFDFLCTSYIPVDSYKYDFETRFVV